MLKMNDLVKLTQTPKSTVLYYVKEGLLPEPLKDKPNFHLYDDCCVSLLAFIKYLQTNFNASISQIKQLFSQPDFDWQKPYESLISSIGIIMSAENETFSSESLCQEFSISETELQTMVEEGLINPRDGIFTAKERDILAILCRCNKTEREMVRNYLQTAKTLAQKEVALTLSALKESDRKDETLKHLFDLLLVLKPYVLNMQTLKVYQMENAK
ncbi:MerR family transcriptional regulator [Rodentibacter haemolyticus]|uniref:MerR family transcriptional regulator n=1 Tax=Rodentibacter haemolyticus TaxID=2778911 RepID=A0ABX6V0J9_9PAST|nr:MerR family transcriptional regulator [Rodentibacter haemolyticus]QPB43642.1 MerR family transcriptional regulator [Rodentibacter haemolyticus]